jgi:hypothetical protein
MTNEQMIDIDPLPIEIAPWKTKNLSEIARHEQHIYRFGNGYGASVVTGEYTYGGDAGLYELAVIHFDGDDFELTYDTPITDDVVGWLDVPAVAELLARIAAL